MRFLDMYSPILKDAYLLTYASLWTSVEYNYPKKFLLLIYKSSFFPILNRVFISLSVLLCVRFTEQRHGSKRLSITAGMSGLQAIIPSHAVELCKAWLSGISFLSQYSISGLCVWKILGSTFIKSRFAHTFYWEHIDYDFQRWIW